MQTDSGRPGARRLEGWQEISDYLNVTARQAQTWRKELRLPIRGGRIDRVRVWAWTYELDQWREGHGAAGLKPPEATPAPETNPPSAPSAAGSRPHLAKLTGIGIGIALVILGALTWRLVQRRPGTDPGVIPASAWQLQTIHTVEDGKETIWRYFWHDIQFLGSSEGWLCGEVGSGGPTGDIGAGVLLHTSDGGNSWSPITERIPSGSGAFHWGNNAVTWRDVASIGSIRPQRRSLGAARWQVELWIGSETGVYWSGDGGTTWERSTPRPDDTAYSQTWAYLSSTFLLPSTGDVYAAGWFGVARWSPTMRSWGVEISTRSYLIRRVYGYPGDPDWDVWAVGQSGDKNDPYRMIYHRKGERNWARLRVAGLDKEPEKGGLTDIVLTDSMTGFAVGPDGVIVKGTRNKDGAWTWFRIDSPSNRDLYSIDYIGHTLWIAGEQGLVLSSSDLGRTWQQKTLTNENGKTRTLSRVTVTGDQPWILGNGVVYKYTPAPVK